MTLLRLFSNKMTEDKLKLTKSDFGDEWMVKRGHSILYVGTKEKCKLFMSQSQLAHA